MIRTKLALLAFPVILLAAPMGTAKEVNKLAQTEPAKEQFYVYGGSCARTIKLQGTYDDIQFAWAAAEKCRSKDRLNYVTVRTGAHDRDYFGRNATQYKVYSTLCLKSFPLHSTVASADKAHEIADKLKKDGYHVEIVLHYAPK